LLKEVISLLKIIINLNKLMEYAVKVNYLILSVLIISGCNDLNSDDLEDNEIEVYISTGELQCQGNGLAISITKNYLINADIEVKAESCGSLTGVSQLTVCGADTGNLHVFTIDKAHSQVAENIGFTIPDSSVSEDDFEKVLCNS